MTIAQALLRLKSVSRGERGTHFAVFNSVF